MFRFHYNNIFLAKLFISKKLSCTYNLLRYVSSKSIFSDVIVLKMYRKHMNRFLAVYWKEDFVSTKWHSFEIHYCPEIVTGIKFIYFNKVFAN